MYPILFHIPDWVPLLGGGPITSFGAMMFLAFFVGGFLIRDRMDAGGYDGERAWDLIFTAVVAGVVGAKLYYVLLNFDQLLEDPRFLVARGGLVWYGGFGVAAAAVVWHIRRMGLPLDRMADAIAPALALGYAIGRVGCFLVGDDYGLPTASWVGVRFPEGSPPSSVSMLEGLFGVNVDPALVAEYGQIVPVHPTQLYEAVLSLGIFAILWRLRDHGRAAGWLFMLWLACAGAERLPDRVLPGQGRPHPGHDDVGAAHLGRIGHCGTLWDATARERFGGAPVIILHASDIHFGKRHAPASAEAFLKCVHALESDLIVISGDFTQRAKVGEYTAARTFLDRLPDRPLIVTPGNHDVPLYRVWERAFTPFRNYRRYIAPELDSVTRVPGATVVSINSATALTAIVNGRLSASQLDYAERELATAQTNDLRILVTHHPIVGAPDSGGDQILSGAEWIARRLTRMGVDLVLSGHLHRAYVATTADVCEQPVSSPTTWIAHSGTTTSSRGRGRERGLNTFNRIEISKEHLIFERYMYGAGRTAFEPVERRIVPRGGRYLGKATARPPDRVRAVRGSFVGVLGVVGGSHGGGCTPIPSTVTESVRMAMRMAMRVATRRRDDDPGGVARPTGKSARSAAWRYGSQSAAAVGCGRAVRTRPCPRKGWPSSTTPQVTGGVVRRESDVSPTRSFAGPF